MLPFILSYHLSINKTHSQLLTFILQRQHCSLPHLSCVRNLQAAWKDFIGFLHIRVATCTTLNYFIILSVILCLQSWGWAHTAFAVPPPALGREFAVVLSPGDISSACPRGAGTWSWAAGIGVHMLLAYPACLKMALMTLNSQMVIFI